MPRTTYGGDLSQRDKPSNQHDEHYASMVCEVGEYGQRIEERRQLGLVTIWGGRPIRARCSFSRAECFIEDFRLSEPTNPAWPAGRDGAPKIRPGRVVCLRQ